MLKSFPLTNYANPRTNEEGRRDRTSLMEILEQLQRPDALYSASDYIKPLRGLFERRSGSVDTRVHSIRDDAILVLTETLSVLRSYNKIGSISALQDVATKQELVVWDNHEDQAAEALRLREVSSDKLGNYPPFQRRLIRYAGLLLHRVVHYCEDLNHIFWTTRGLEGVQQTVTRRIKEHHTQYTASLAEVRHAITQFRLAEQGKATQFFRDTQPQALEPTTIEGTSGLAVARDTDANTTIAQEIVVDTSMDGTRNDTDDPEADTLRFDNIRNGLTKQSVPTHQNLESSTTSTDVTSRLTKHVLSSKAISRVSGPRSTGQSSSNGEVDVNHIAEEPSAARIASTSTSHSPLDDETDSDTVSEASSEDTSDLTLQPTFHTVARSTLPSPELPAAPQLHNGPRLPTYLSSPAHRTTSSTPPTSPDPVLTSVPGSSPLVDLSSTPPSPLRLASDCRMPSNQVPPRDFTVTPPCKSSQLKLSIAAIVSSFPTMPPNK